MKDNFMLYQDQYPPIKDLSHEQKGMLLDAFFMFNAGEDVSFTDPVVAMAFSFFKQSFVRNIKRYEEQCQRNRENGKTGGRPKNTVGLYETEDNPKNPVGLKKADSDPDSDPDSDILRESPIGDLSSPAADDSNPESEGDGPKAPLCPFIELVRLYHETLPELPVVKKHTSTRQTAARGRWRETWKYLRREGKPHDAKDLLDYFTRYFAYVAKSDWLMGRIRPWRADFEWLLNATNFAKVVEGRYHDRTVEAA